MKYKDLEAGLKRSINGSLYGHFQSGCLDFKGAEIAFEIWAGIKISETTDGYYYRGYREKEDSYLDNEVYEELKEKFTKRYNSRMESLYWSNRYLRT